MDLTSNIIVTEAYNGSSQYSLWHNLKVGDELVISMPLQGTGYREIRYEKQMIPPKVTIINTRTDESFTAPINSFVNYLKKIGHETNNG